VNNDPAVLRLQFGAVTLIPSERLVLKDGQPVPFTPKAFDLLAVLASDPARLLTKEHLMQSVWPDAIVEESNLAYHVSAIRKALGENGESERYIETVPKRGYRFIAPVTRIGGDETAAAALAGREAEPPAAGSPISAHRRRWVGAAGGAALAAAALTFMYCRGATGESVASDPDEFEDRVTMRLAETGSFSVSPDGQRYAYAAEGPDGILRFWVRTMSTLPPVPLPGTEVYTIVPPPIWSPDGRSLAFDPTGVLKKVSLDGGEPQSLCELDSVAVGGSWNTAGDILVGSATGGILRCPDTGGVASIVTVPERPDERHLFPSFLSDERRFLYLRISRTNPEVSGIYVGELGSTAPLGGRLITTGFGATFVPATGSGPGLIVFARDGSLFAQRFDEGRLQLIGDARQLADSVGSYLDGAFFAVSQRLLVHRAPDPDFQLAWFDKEGRELQRVGAPRRYAGLALSPRGDRAVVAIHAPQGTTNQDAWLFDFSRNASPRRMTMDPEIESGFAWSTNDRFVFGLGGGLSGVRQVAVDGSPEPLFTTDRPVQPTSASRDGRTVLFVTPGKARMGGEIWLRSGDGPTARLLPFLQRERDQSDAQLSSDGRWVAYVSNETGPNEVYVTSLQFDSSGNVVTGREHIQVSKGGGYAPRWGGEGELFFLMGDGSVMAVKVGRAERIRPGAPKRLFRVPGVSPEWGVTSDGQRFLFAVPVTPPPDFSIVRDWTSALPR
jgi:DNA-binding winged helix-turn-helix (wHTH) protein